jgi:hypothetical protein
MKSIEFQLVSKREVVIDHLLKLYYYRNSDWDRVWKRSIFSAVHSVSSYKGSHKLPPRDWIYNCLWGGIEDLWFPRFSKFLQGVADGFGYSEGPCIDVSLMINNPRPHETYGLIHAYIFWLSGKLSNDGIVSPAEVYGEIDRILSEFPFSPGKRFAP